jgi:hypothetical protein
MNSTEFELIPGDVIACATSLGADDLLPGQSVEVNIEYRLPKQSLRGLTLKTRRKNQNKKTENTHETFPYYTAVDTVLRIRNKLTGASK